MRLLLSTRPIDFSNEASKLGVINVIYAMTHPTSTVIDPGGGVVGPGRQETTTMSRRLRRGLDGVRNGI